MVKKNRAPQHDHVICNSEYEQEMPQSHTTDQPMGPSERGNERQQKLDIQNTT